MNLKIEFEVLKNNPCLSTKEVLIKFGTASCNQLDNTVEQ